VEKSEFAERRKEFAKKTVGELIESLASENLQTRFFAEMRLRDVTNT